VCSWLGILCGGWDVGGCFGATKTSGVAQRVGVLTVSDHPFVVPDRRFYRPHPKKACRCKHGITAHHKKVTPKGVTHPCWYPDCDCKDYRPAKK
jgi:hypothetical protein